MELMIALAAFSRHNVHQRQLASLKSQALSWGTEFDWHELAAYDASAATVLASVASFFEANGRDAPFERDYYRHLSRIGFFEGMDRVPYREMDLAYSLGLMGEKNSGNAMAAWCRDTAFGQSLHISRYTFDDLYSITHAVFYLTDFGTRPLETYIDHATASRVRHEIRNLTGVVLRADNIDVLGELLLCWLFCQVPNNDLNLLIFRSALERLLSATTPDGAVAPSRRVYERVRTGQARFEDIYHTTLVCAMAFALVERYKANVQ